MATKTKCCGGNKTVRDLILFPDGEVVPPPTPSYLLLEDGFKILLESGDGILLE